MATVKQWTPFGVALNLTATAGTVTRTSATQYTVAISVSWEVYWTGAETNYGMDATSGGKTVTISPFGKDASRGSASLTGTYSISGNAGATKTITVTFKNYNTDNGKSATKAIDLSVSVPAWTSYTVSYNANGGSGAPSAQTKWRDQALTLSSTKPTRTGYSFQGWATSASGSVAYAAGASYTANAGVTLYAVWKANTYTVSYNANGGSGAPGSQTKTYGVTLALSSTRPTRTNYNFKGWGTSASATTVSYAPGASYTANAAITLYAIWELAYVKPRITNLSVARCDANGTVKMDGTYALVKFSWACDEPVSQIGIYWKLTTAPSYDYVEYVSASGTSGTVTKVVGGTFSVESSYNIRATVWDTIQYTNQPITLSSMMFTIHARPGGNGIAFGKMSELPERVEMGWDIELGEKEVLRDGLIAYTSKTLLWVNASPTSVFPAQTIAVDLSQYQQIEIHCTINGGIVEGGLMYSFNINVTSANSAYWPLIGGWEALEYRQARATVSGVAFTGSWRATSLGSLSERDDRMIPYKIYGIKGVR